MGRYTTVQACELLLIKKRAYSSRWFSEFFHLSCGLFLSPGDGNGEAAVVPSHLWAPSHHTPVRWSDSSTWNQVLVYLGLSLMPKPGRKRGLCW